jgi:hypothetical protein
LIISIDTEIRIYNNSNPTAIELLTVIERENYMHVEVFGNLLITGDKRNSEILVINITNPLEPEILSSHQGQYIYDPILNMFVHETTLFTSTANIVDVYDFSNPRNILKKGFYQSSINLSIRLYASDDLLFNLGGQYGVEIINVTQLDEPYLLTIIDETEYKERTMAVMMKENYLLTVPFIGAEIKVYDMMNPSNPELVARGDVTGHFSTITSWEDNLYVADYNKICIMNITNPEDIITEYMIPGSEQIRICFEADDSYLYWSDFYSYGVTALDNAIPYDPSYYPTPTDPVSIINLKIPTIIIVIIAPILVIVFIQKTLRYQRKKSRKKN